MSKKKVVLFKIGVNEVPYLNPSFGYELINHPDGVDPLSLRAEVTYIDKDGETEYKTTQLVHSIEVYSELVKKGEEND